MSTSEVYDAVSPWMIFRVVERSNNP